MLEEMNALSGTVKPRPKYHVSAIVKDRLNQSGNVVRIVFQVAVLNHDDIALYLTESRAESGSFTLVA